MATFTRGDQKVLGIGHFSV